MSKPPLDPRKRRRRARARLAAFIGYTAAALGLAWFFESQATTTVIFVRNAETELPVAAASRLPEDCTLSAAGRARAQAAIYAFEYVDGPKGIDAIYASAARCTQQTVEPLARRLGLEIEIDDPYEIDRFMREILREHKGKVVLIAAPADAIFPLIDELHGSKRLRPIEDDEHDRMYIIAVPWFGDTKTITPPYGEPWSGGLQYSEPGENVPSRATVQRR